MRAVRGEAHLVLPEQAAATGKRPWDSTPLQEAVRLKYRATELHREQNYEEILAKTRAEEAAEEAVRAAGEAKQRAEATQDAMENSALAQLRAQWNRPPGLLTTMMVDMGVQTSFVSDLSIE